MKSTYDDLAKRCETDGQRKTLDEEWARFRPRFAEKYRDMLAAKSRCISPMITGPANFPVEKNRKRMESFERRIDELFDFRKRAIDAIRKRLWPVDCIVKAADPNAVDTLCKKLEQRQQQQETMKAANRILRSKRTSDEKISELIALGIPEAEARKLRSYDYTLKNNNAEIRRLKLRIGNISAMQAAPTTEEKRADGVKVIHNTEAGRIQIQFPGKPPAEMRDKLKKNGFRWARGAGVWQRHLNAAGRDAVERVLRTEGSTA
jgi:hypothetical protein